MMSLQKFQGWVQSETWQVVLVLQNRKKVHLTAVSDFMFWVWYTNLLHICWWKTVFDLTSALRNLWSRSLCSELHSLKRTLPRCVYRFGQSLETQDDRPSRSKGWISSEVLEEGDLECEHTSMGKRLLISTKVHVARDEGRTLFGWTVMDLTESDRAELGLDWTNSGVLSPQPTWKELSWSREMKIN